MAVPVVVFDALPIPCTLMLRQSDNGARKLPHSMKKTVGAKHVDQVVSELMMAEERQGPVVAAPWMDGGPAGDFGAIVDGVGHPFAVAQHQPPRHCNTPPPAPILPWWFTPETERLLENGECVAVEDAETNNNNSIQQQFAQPAASSQWIEQADVHAVYHSIAPLEVQVADPSSDFAQSRGASSDSPDGQPSAEPIVVPSSGFHHGRAPFHSPRTHDELRAQLRAQLEYYFSRENLSNDKFLRSQMDNDQYVPIGVIASFPKVTRLTNDLQLIVDVLKESSSVQVDEKAKKVRPASNRCTILLRDIADEDSRADIEEMLTSRGCPTYVSLEFSSINRSWYVSFETEEATRKAYLYLMSVATFNGQAINARITGRKAPQQTGSAPQQTPSPQQSVESGGGGGGSARDALSSSAPPVNGVGRAVDIPNSLPGLLSPTPAPPPPTSVVSPADSNHQMGASPEFAVMNGYWPQSPMVTMSSVVHGAPTFDVGYVLSTLGFQLHGTYRPPSTVVHVPPGTMANSLRAHANGGHALPSRNYGRFSNGGRGRGRGAAHLRDSASPQQLHVHNQPSASDRSSGSSTEPSRPAGARLAVGQRLGPHHGHLAPRAAHHHHHQHRHGGYAADDSVMRDRDFRQPTPPAVRPHRRFESRDDASYHYDRIRGRFPPGRRGGGGGREFINSHYHHSHNYQQAPRDVVRGQASRQDEASPLEPDEGASPPAKEPTESFDPNDQASFPSLPTTEAESAPAARAKVSNESPKCSTAKGATTVGQRKTGESETLRVQNDQERSAVVTKPSAPTFSSVAAGRERSDTSSSAPSKSPTVSVAV